MSESESMETYGTATYSPEDNKLRLYPFSRLDKETYSRVKQAGFKWAPKQELFVAPKWTPGREDLLLELCGEIGDEDYSPEERAADRAERFSEYRDKRLGEATASADRFDAGPAAFGHQNRNRAERAARRHDRIRTGAVSQWSKAEYWQYRTEGVIANALYKSSPEVRRGRIKKLETELRNQEGGMAIYAKRYKSWSKVPTMEGADSVIPRGEDGKLQFTNLAGSLAYKLSSDGRWWEDHKHPRSGAKASLNDMLTDHKDPVTPAEVAAMWLKGKWNPESNTPCSDTRWLDHYKRRLEYERAMLAQEGGTAADANMVVGGWIGNNQIYKVNKSSVTGKVVSVTLKLPGDRWGNTREGSHMRVFNIERLPEGAYREPTEEERTSFVSAVTKAKKESKAKQPKAASLINPTMADAEKLQAIWNQKAKREWESRKNYGECPVTTVTQITQAQYSAHSKGTYANYKVVDVCELMVPRYIHPWVPSQNVGTKTIFKVRRGPGKDYLAPSVVVITDKPQGSIPWLLEEEPVHELSKA